MCSGGGRQSDRRYDPAPGTDRGDRHRRGSAAVRRGGRCGEARRIAGNSFGVGIAAGVCGVRPEKGSSVGGSVDGGAMLKRLTVRGFKSIRAMDGLELRSVNVLVGDNEAGKSNLLEALHFLGAMADGTQYRVVDDGGGPDGLLFGGSRTTEAVEIAAEFVGGHYRVRLVPVGEGLRFAEEERLWNGQREAVTAEGGGSYPKARLFPQVGPKRVAGWQANGEALGGWPRYHFCDTGRLAGVRRAHEVRDNLALKPDGSNLAPYLRFLSMRHEQDYRNIVETVRLVAPAFGDLFQRREVGERMSLEWTPRDEPDTVFGPRQLSDGVLRFLCLATLLNQPTEFQPGLILIDEPELGLHPRELVLLASLLRGAAEDRQVVVSTQSADLVSQFRAEEVIVANREFGPSTFERLNAEELKVWLDRYSLGEMWKANLIGGPPVQ